MNKAPLTLAIDTSCDETSVSVVEGLTVLSNVLPSQIAYHKKYGGVVPSIAKLLHQERIDNVITEALKQAQKRVEDMDFIAVTYGPGLAIALEVGIRKAEELSKKYSKPLIAVNHMEGHLLSGFAERKFQIPKPKSQNLEFPALGVLISGGHTELVLVKSFGDYEKVGETLDDACGECFDKCGRMLGLGYPAGPVISKFAKEHRKNLEIRIYKDNLRTLVKAVNKKTKEEYSLPIPMLSSRDLNFSYSGLKTAFRDLVAEKLKESDSEVIKDLCVTFETAAIAQITFKLKKAIEKYNPKEIWLGGGVVASAYLRSEVRKVCKEYKIKLRYPYTKKLTGDNAAMIGVAANIRIMNTKNVEEIVIKDAEKIDREPSLSF